MGASKGSSNTVAQAAEEALLKAGALQSAIFNSANFSSIATDAKGGSFRFSMSALSGCWVYTAAGSDGTRSRQPNISDPQELMRRAENAER